MLTENRAIRTQTFNRQCDIWNWVFRNSDHLCQPMDSVCNSVDLTESNVISAPLSVNFAGLLWMCSEFVRAYRNCEIRIITSVPLSVCASKLTSYREMFDEFSKTPLKI